MNIQTTKNKIIFFCIALLLFLIIGSIIMFTPLGDISVNGQSIDIMDAKFVYNADFVFETFDTLGKEGRKQYTVFHIVDYFFLVSYGLLMISLTKLVTDKKSIWFYIPLLVAIFDFIENTLIEIASAIYPDITYPMANTISLFTTIKWSVGIAWFFVFVICSVLYMIKKYKQ